ncbi:MAG: serine/threonine protein kinase [Thermoguttaceae bacterium]
MTQSLQMSVPVAQACIGSKKEDRFTRAGQWKLVKLAAEGGWANIYQAQPACATADLPAAYALKLLPSDRQNDPQAIRLLQREAVVGKKVSHPHLIPILDVDLYDPPRFVVMPWLEGATLEQRLRSGERFDLPDILWIARQTAEALDALFKSGWMHADIKPSNIMVSPERHVTLLDLGFARRGDETGSAADRCVLGTFHYIAPEFLTSALRADIRSDIYSLGAVLYRMLSGQLPFEGEDMAELASRHREAIPANLHLLAPHLPAEVVRLVHKMLSKNPLRRPQTPAELIETLMRLEIETFSQRRDAPSDVFKADSLIGQWLQSG